MGGTEHLTVERHGATLVLTMNRPEAKNALSLPLLVGLYDGWLEADADDTIRSVVLTGAGGDFCAGMDLKALAGKGMAGDQYRDRLKADPDLHWKAMLRHHRPRKPIIAAVEGYCVAGGTEILQGTDIRVAGEGATFGLFEVKRGSSRSAARRYGSRGRSRGRTRWRCCCPGGRTRPRRRRGSGSSGGWYRTGRRWPRRWRSRSGSTRVGRLRWRR